MQAKEFYDVGLKAYSGDKKAACEFFERLAPTAVRISKIFGVLPGFTMAKIAIESGYMTNKWNETAEAIAGVKMKRKAQDYNNILSMNCFEENKKYLEWMPAPAWAGYRDTFGDWGPHGNNKESLVFTFEPWKAYKTIEDAIEDWCANVRYQAYSHGRTWEFEDLISQLLATESYTPEGSSEGVRAGLHFAWQEQIMRLYEEYGLEKYDKEVDMVKMTTANLDEHIRQAYIYARTHCKYGPTDRCDRPMEDGAADCVGLALRALYTMGYTKGAHNINEIHAVCKQAGLVRSDNINDVYRHHGIVCMSPKGDRANVAHVYYSLGGSSLNDIDKYDLGSNERIHADQPFRNVPVNEWTDRRDYLCIWHVPPSDKLEDVPAFELTGGVKATVTKNTGVYAGPGTAWRKKASAKAGDSVTAYQVVTNEKGNLFRIIKIGKTIGYAFSNSIKPNSFTAYNGVVKGTDGNLSLRVGAGGGCYKVAGIPEGTVVRVDGEATANDGGKWLHVKWGKKRGFVSCKYVKKK